MENHFFQKFLKKAKKTLGSKREVFLLISKAMNKLSLNKEHFRSISDDLKLMLLLMKDWAAGRYRGVSYLTVLYICSGLIYFVNPLDLVPDFLAGVGLLDDLSILSWVISKIKGELEKYKAWKE